MLACVKSFLKVCFSSKYLIRINTFYFIHLKKVFNHDIVLMQRILFLTFQVISKVDRNLTLNKNLLDWKKIQVFADFYDRKL
jgi:hypothetical protein